MTRTPDMLAAIGRALHGEQGWQSALAADLGISRETLRRWLNGHTHLPPDHGVWRDAMALMERAAAGREAEASLIRELARRIGEAA